MDEKFQKLSVVSCSNNPDMHHYFSLKRKYFPDLQCIGPPSDDFNNLLNRSCFSRTNGISLWLVIDLFFSFFQSIRLKLKGVEIVIFDNVHVVNIFYGCFLRLLNIRQIHTIHDQVVHPGVKSKSTEFYYRYFCPKFANSYIFFSENKFLFDPSKNYHRLKLSGFDDNTSSPNSNSNDVIFFGRIEPYKGLEFLDAVSSYLSVHHPDSKLIIMGSGKSCHLDNLKDNCNVELLNSVYSKADLINKSRSCCVSIMPYTSATQSGVMIESYSLGLPAVFFDVGSLRENCDNKMFGLAVNLGDIDAFNSAISHFIKYPFISKDYLKENFGHSYGIPAFRIQFRELLASIEL
jgi:glycosyltransferase involved in cell wall biosynthesis